jgi:hypothetical protein
VAIDRSLIGFAACLLHALCNEVFSQCNLLRASRKTTHEAWRKTFAPSLARNCTTILTMLQIACKILHAILKLRQKWLLDSSRKSRFDFPDCETILNKGYFAYSKKRTAKVRLGSQSTAFQTELLDVFPHKTTSIFDLLFY